MNLLQKPFFIILIVLICGGVSCTPTYKSFTERYKKDFTTSSSTPDYSNLNYWAAHPWKKDPSDSIPKPLLNDARDSSVDVFFLHPTTLTDKKLNGVVWNADINDGELNAKTDYTSILYQASVFNQHARVFAPRYRQAHLYSFFTPDSVAGKKALAFAYEDVRAAFQYYLQYYNNGRPIIIASHSQGTVHASMLLKEFFKNKPLANQLVCAYLTGMILPKSSFHSLKPCHDSSSVGCFTGWRTFRKNYIPGFVEKENGSSWVINPISWTMDSLKLSRKKIRALYYIILIKSFLILTVHKSNKVSFGWKNQGSPAVCCTSVKIITREILTCFT